MSNSQGISGKAANCSWRFPQLVKGFQGLAAADGLGALVAQLLRWDARASLCSRKSASLNETFVMEPLEGVGLFI